MINDLTRLIEEEFKKLNLPGHLPQLYDPIRYSLDLGGKRIRPILVALSSAIFGGKFREISHQAIAVELFHNFTLIHDDIMDNSPIRRGQASVFRKWDMNTAILSGDVLYSLSLKEVSNCPAELLHHILDTFVKMAIAVCEGQNMDMEFETKSHVSVKEYMQMIGLKTANLLASSLLIGSQMTKSDKKSQKALFEFGMKAGTSFQLMDDYLDAFGDPEKFGKKPGGDILGSKKTFLHIRTMERLDEKERTAYIETLASTKITDQEKVDKVKGYYENSGAASENRELVQKLFNEAVLLTAEVKGDQKAIKELINLSHQLVNREK